MRAISLQRNLFTEFPAVLANFKRITILNLYRNRLNSIPGFVSEMTALEYIWLGHNQITVLPEDLWKLKKLKTLDLYNNINNMPKDVGRFPSLKRLNLKKNPIPAGEVERITKALPKTNIKFTKK
ncbi:MAG: hypothetical protein GY757_10930 [bacterium]|nr:hypothetical protein [bacterium]